MAQDPETDDAHQAEYQAILLVFERFLGAIDGQFDTDEVLEELMSLRADFAIQHAIKGFGMGYEEALYLVRNYENISPEEKAKRDIIVAAIDNLVDFSVAAEYQMSVEVMDLYDTEGSEKDIEDEARGICAKYNDRYANVENKDIEHSLLVASSIALLPTNIVITYLTQGDERVRPWHMQYDGFSAPKSDYPQWLVPPIDWGCRCYLEHDIVYAKATSVLGKADLEKPEWVNPIFSESVAFGGRIFSAAHPYFNVDKKHSKKLKSISKKLKDRYFNAEG